MEKWLSSGDSHRGVTFYAGARLRGAGAAPDTLAACRAVAKVPVAPVRRALSGYDWHPLDRCQAQERAWHSGSDAESGNWRPSSWPRTCRNLPAILSARH